MKPIRLCGLLLTLALCSLTNPVQAGDFFGGIKAGIVDPEASGFDPTTTASAQLGYEFADFWIFDVAVEGEITRSITDGDAPGGDYSYEQNSVFTSLRTAGPVYFTARAGFVDARIEQPGRSSSDDGIAYGIGVGFSTGIRWEIEWTTYEFNNDDVNQLGFHLSF